MPTETDKILETPKIDINYDLDELLEGINEDKQHDLIFPEDGSKGNEVW
ncbi:MAG: hypothetical protein ABEJ02_04910 [Candidatus Paceibacteria bacterium]